MQEAKHAIGLDLSRCFSSYIFLIPSKSLHKAPIPYTVSVGKTITFPNIDPSLYRHFIRGFMDGDGCIIVGNTKGRCILDFTSASYNFILQLKDVLQPISTHIGICKETKYDVWHLRCGGKQVQNILNWLYEDSTVYMNRKYFTKGPYLLECNVWRNETTL